MELKEAYYLIVNEFENAFSWLGKQFAEDFLLSVASGNIQRNSNPPYRVKRHLLLYWQKGFLKSTLLMKAHDILGSGMSLLMSDITQAALRGTVEGGTFLVPFALKRPFGICTEFGQIIGGYQNTEMIQSLLNLLEEGNVTVSMGKISNLNEYERERATADYDIKFIDRNTFTYHSDWIILAATYNRKFLVDSAFESRFVIMTPNKRLNSELVEYINTAPKFNWNNVNEAVETLREKLVEKKAVDCNIVVPKEAMQYINDTRELGAVKSTVVCKKWWGFNPSHEEIVELAKGFKEARENAWKTTDDKIIELLERNPMTPKELAKELSVTTRNVYYALNKMRSIVSAQRREDGQTEFAMK